MSHHPITVTPTKNANGVFEWTLTYGGRSGSKNGEYPTVHLRHGGKNERFEITLVDSTYGITFSNDPLWIAPGACPVVTGIDKTLIDRVETGPTVVKFRDLNSNANEMSLWYRLNFNVPGLKAGEEGTYLDPEIRNGGGGGPGMNLWRTVAAIVAVAAASFAAYEAFFEK